jgi:hypothetical protein
MQQQYQDLLIDALLDEGFTVEEAQNLVRLQAKLEEKAELEVTLHLLFVRWLVEQGHLTEG